MTRIHNLEIHTPALTHLVMGKNMRIIVMNCCFYMHISYIPGSLHGVDTLYYPAWHTFASLTVFIIIYNYAKSCDTASFVKQKFPN